MACNVAYATARRTLLGYNARMDLASAAVIHNAEDLSRWAAEAIKETDELIAITRVRPLTADEQNRNLTIQREGLVRLTQQKTLLKWATEARLAPMWSWRKAWATWNLWRFLRRRNP